MRAAFSFATAATLALAALPAFAQPIISAKSGVIAGAEGKVLIDNQDVQQSVTHFPEVKEGSVLSTQDGRVEVMLPPGFMLRMGENGSLKMVANRLVDTRVELLSGSIVVEVDQAKEDYNVSVALKDGVVTLSKVGVYRFNAEPAEVKVFHGMAVASVHNGGDTVMVGTGKLLGLTGGPATAEKFDVEQTDSLDNWSRRRAEAMALANISGAKYANDNYSSSGSSNGGGWVYNPYFDMYTYMPMTGRMCNSFYGMCYYSPAAAYQTFYIQPMYNGGGVPAFNGNRVGAAITPMSGSSIAAPVASAPATGVSRVSNAPSMSAPSSGSSGSSGSAASAAAGAVGHGGAAPGGTAAHGK